MGGTGSKTGDDKNTDNSKSEAEVTDASTKVESSSSGFHILELHLSSMGYGMVFMCFLAAAVAWFLWHRRQKRKRAAREDAERAAGAKARRDNVLRAVLQSGKHPAGGSAHALLDCGEDSAVLYLAGRVQQLEQIARDHGVADGCLQQPARISYAREKRSSRRYGVAMAADTEVEDLSDEDAGRSYMGGRGARKDPAILRQQQ